MLEVLIIVAVCVVVMGIAARLALPTLRQYRAIQNDKRQAQLERELHMGDYAALTPPTSFYEQQPRPAPQQRVPDPRPVQKVNRASAPPKPKVLHIEDIPDVPMPPQPPKKSAYQRWVDGE